MKTFVIAAGFVLLVAALALPVMAHGPGWGLGGHMMGYWGGGPGYHHGYGPRYDEGLSDEQRAQLEELCKEFYGKTEKLRNELWAKSAELDTVLNSATPDVDKAKALQVEISALRAKMAQNRVEVAQRIKDRWNEIQDIAGAVPSAEDIAGQLAAVEAPSDPQEICLTEDDVANALRHARYLRARFTVDTLGRVLGLW